MLCSFTFTNSPCAIPVTTEGKSRGIGMEGCGSGRGGGRRAGYDLLTSPQ